MPSLTPAVPAALNETLPVTSKRIEAELSASQGLAWKHTAMLEKKLAEGEAKQQGGEPPVALLRQALYNVRQHEVFLKKLLVGCCPCESFTYLFRIKYTLHKTYTTLPPMATSASFPTRRTQSSVPNAWKPCRGSSLPR